MSEAIIPVRLLFITQPLRMTAIAQLLLESGASIDAKDNSGKTALLYAACGGHEKIVALLISHGAEVNAPSQAEPQKPTSSPLSCALKYRHHSIAEILRKAGASE